MSIAARSRGNSLLPSATRSWGPNESTASRWGHREADSRRAREGGSPNKKRAAGANCAPPKDPSATRAVGVSPVDEIAQRTRPVNSAALDFVRGALSAKRPHEHANAWCCGIRRVSTKCLSQRQHRCVHQDAAQCYPPSQHKPAGLCSSGRAVAARCGEIMRDSVPLQPSDSS